MTIFDEIKESYLLAGQDNMTEDEIKADMNTKRTVSTLMSCASLVLTALNIYNQYWVMAISTAVLALVFAFCISFSKNLANRRLVTLIMSLAIGFIFSYYTIFGENEGFAILWTMLVPMVGSLLIGLKAGVLLSFYFEVLFLVLFYTPLHSFVEMNYSRTFLIRYPILYFFNILASLYLASRKDHYKREVENMALRDGLTGLFNRRYFETTLVECKEHGDLNNMVIFMLDVNRLKYVNDTFGHQAGDELLISAGKYMQDCFTEHDSFVCRIGGDEFAVIAFVEHDDIAKKLDELSKYSFVYKSKVIPEPSLSAGVVEARDYKDHTIDQLISLADQAMYRAKNDYYRQHGLDRRRH